MEEGLPGVEMDFPGQGRMVDLMEAWRGGPGTKIEQEEPDEGVERG